MAEDFNIHTEKVALGDSPDTLIASVVADLENQYTVVGFHVLMTGDYRDPLGHQLPYQIMYIVATQLTE
jgi:hypothetical protein